MAYQLVQLDKKELKEKAALLSEMFYGLAPKDVVKTGHAINLLARQGLLPSHLLESGRALEKGLLMGCYGKRLGLPLIDALNNLYIINNKVALHTDAGRILVLRSGLCEQYEVHYDEETKIATCTMKRKGMVSPYTATFSAADAQRAGLLNRVTWKKYPKIMLIWRATWFAMRAHFADILYGLANLEEQCDIQEIGPDSPLEEESPLLEALQTSEVQEVVQNDIILSAAKEKEARESIKAHEGQFEVGIEEEKNESI